jgi:guanylate kinase
MTSGDLQAAGSGILFIIAAPSGAGKTSLVKGLLARDSALKVSVSHTTRPRRLTEHDGVNYHFVDPARFQALVEQGEFLEHATVFGNHYGTARASVASCFASGMDVILEIDWQGAAQVRLSHPNAVSIFILPPSLETLRARLKSRGEDPAEVMEKRLAQARTEISHHRDFDYLIVNDNFDTALDELHAIIRAERCRRENAIKRLKSLVDSLLSQP